jgi:SSS family solute:Na+ symporter
MTTLIVIIGYLCLLLALGFFSNKLFRGTSKDYFVASHSIGPFLLLMSVFGTTMTAFALVGSTGKSFERGIGTYGLMASISGLVHAAIFFLIGIRLWAFGKKHGFITQIQFFRARFESDSIGYLLFPILVLLVIPYLLIGIIGAGKTIEPVTAGAFPALFTNPTAPQWLGGVPPWLTGLVVSLVVLSYVFHGWVSWSRFCQHFSDDCFYDHGDW